MDPEGRCKHVTGPNVTFLGPQKETKTNPNMSSCLFCRLSYFVGWFHSCSGMGAGTWNRKAEDKTIGKTRKTTGRVTYRSDHCNMSAQAGWKQGITNTPCKMCFLTIIGGRSLMILKYSSVLRECSGWALLRSVVRWERPGTIAWRQGRACTRHMVC